MKRFLENDIRLLALPLTILLAIVVLSLISGKIIFDNIGRLNGELSDNKKNETMLQTKLTSLQKINPQVSTDSESVVNALPGTSGVLTTLNELQFQSNSSNIILENIKSSANGRPIGSSAVSATEIDFDADGSYTDLSGLIKAFKNLLPITRFDSIRMSTQSSASGSLYRLSASLLTYWSPLPTVIPSISEPLADLNADETKLLNQIRNMPRPSEIVVSGVSAEGTVGRLDPFSN